MESKLSKLKFFVLGVSLVAEYIFGGVNFMSNVNSNPTMNDSSVFFIIIYLFPGGRVWELREGAELGPRVGEVVVRLESDSGAALYPIHNVQRPQK